MRLFVVMLMAITAVFAVVPTSSFAATVTKEQVVNVCVEKSTPATATVPAVRWVAGAARSFATTSARKINAPERS